MFKKIGLCLIGLVILSAIFADTFEIQQMSESEIILKFTLPNYEIENVKQFGNDYQQINAIDANHYSSEGQPLLPSYSSVLGIPVDGEIDISIINKNETELKNISLKPLDKQLLDNENEKIKMVTFVDAKFYAQNNFFPIKTIQKGSKAFIGDRNSQGLIINPFRYNPTTKTLKIVNEITIKITIYGDKTKSENWRSNNKMANFSDLFINNKFSKYWIKEREKFTDYEPDRLSYVDELQLIVDQEGICKVNYSYLVDSLQTWQDSLGFVTGFDWNSIDPRNLELRDEFGAVPIYFSGERDGSFDEGDFFEFYCHPHYGDDGYYDDFTSENTYVLKLNDSVGARMAVEDGGLNITDESMYQIPIAYKQNVHFEEQASIEAFGHLTGMDFLEDCYMWRYITSPNLVSVDFELEYPSTYGNKRFGAEATFMGISYREAIMIDHHAIVRVNSAMVEDIEWEDQGRKIAKNDSIYNEVLINGTNQLNISLPGDLPIGEDESIALDNFEIDYWREYKTDKDYIKFNKPEDEDFGLYQFELNNFSTDDISIYKIGSSKIENIQVEAFSSENNLPPYKCTFQDSVLAGNIQFYATTEANKITPKFLKPNLPSDLHNPNFVVDYLIITKQEFCDDEGTLLIKDVWQGEGVNVKIVDIQDIFDEFNHGIRSVESMKDFVLFAYNNWNISHVLLLGDGNDDERDWSINRDKNIIPFKKVWHWKSGGCASDTWLGCIIGDDGVPDISVGRINVWEKEQILPVAEKIQNFVQNKNYQELWQPRLTFTAGGKATDSEDIFAQQSEFIKSAWVPREVDVTRIYTAVESYTQEYHGGTFDLKDMIDDGTQIVQFMGHGGGQIWADYNLFNRADVATLTNEVYPLFMSLSCYGSAFGTPGAGCLGEYLILEPEAGSIGQIGFTGLGYKDADEDFALAFYEGIFGRGIRNVGELKKYTVAKLWTSFPEVYEENNHGKAKYALTYGASLIGDPMVNLWFPPKDGVIEVRNSNTLEVQHNVCVGDTVDIVAIFDNVNAGQILIQNENEITQNIAYDLPSIGGEITVAEYIVPDIDDEIGLFHIKAYGFSDDNQVSAYSEMTIGKSSVADLVLEPTQPTYLDSVMISSNFFDKEGIQNVECRVFLNLSSKSKNRDYTDIPMVWNETENRYYLEYKIPPQNTGAWIRYEFRIFDLNNELTTSERFIYKIFGPEISLSQLRLAEENNMPIIQAFITNTGGTDANNFDVKLWEDIDTIQVIVDSIIVDQLQKTESKWVNLSLPIISQEIDLTAVANQNKTVNESNYGNNYYSEHFVLNMATIPINGGDISSIDDGFSCEIPANMFEEETILYINRMGVEIALNQPDIQPIKTANNDTIYSYEINALNYDSLVDSIYFPNQAILKFNCSLTDTLFNHASQNARIGIYRWIDDFQKWIWVGSELANNNQVVTVIDQVGIYGVFANFDVISPSIEVNVENQEFTNGGYVSDTGIFSFLFSDANGIDIFNEQIHILINNEEIDETKYAVNPSLGNLTHLPVKYQIDLEKGDYAMSVSATDVNNNYKEISFDFIVNDEFDVINFANYPNPIRSKTIDPVNENRTRFTYVLTDDADDVKIKVYTVSGRLIKTFKDLPNSVGYHEYPRSVFGWDCRDDEGVYVANGVYFYKIIAKRGSKTIEKIQKMAILK